ncbi:MAG: methylated-DNA--[protein]-cysteine S-methyltransferase [Betaproteobacteria bacterium]|nr:methylated-DNA--[protein]-cysteine S-methyltransferase [Betaproteobacteria bacterium]
MLTETLPGTGTAPGSRDYERIARAIEFLRRHALEQPDLAAVARRVHLSEFHLQRLFTRWAGVSPKRFLQFLTVEHAKARLAAGRSVLGLAVDVGLSGPGRLHDLFVGLEAMTPGELRAGGRGVQLRIGACNTPFGRCAIALTARGICAMRFADEATDGGFARWLRARWPQAEMRAEPDAIAALGDRIFGPLAAGAHAPLTVLVKGTNFQIQVWRALLEVPRGLVTTYRDLAARAGRPGAARAVGSAVAANPVAYLIPCHRVIRATGMLGGYRWGETRKAAILAWEAAHAIESVRQTVNGER